MIGRKNQSGLTLVELMIASSLSIAILGGMLHLMEGTRYTSRLNDSLSSIHLTGHYGLDLMRTSLKYRGFEGCKRPVSVDPRQEDFIDWEEGAEYTTNVSTSFVINDVARDSLRGFEVDESGGWSPSVPPDLQPLQEGGNPQPIPNSDVVSVYYVTRQSVRPSVDMASLDENIRISDNSMSFSKGDTVFIGDCTRSNLFTITNMPGSNFPISLEHADSSNATEELTYLFNTTSDVRIAYVDTFYVGDTGRKTENNDPVYALYRYRNGESVEIIEGVENLQVMYGQELSTGNVRFLTADEASLNMRLVSVVQVGMLIYHQSSVLDTEDDSTYGLPGQDIVGTGSEGVSHLGGRYMRRVFTETIHMLNRS